MIAVWRSITDLFCTSPGNVTELAKPLHDLMTGPSFGGFYSTLHRRNQANIVVKSTGDEGGDAAPCQVGAYVITRPRSLTPVLNNSCGCRQPQHLVMRSRAGHLRYHISTEEKSPHAWQHVCTDAHSRWFLSARERYRRHAHVSESGLFMKAWYCIVAWE